MKKQSPKEPNGKLITIAKWPENGTQRSIDYDTGTKCLFNRTDGVCSFYGFPEYFVEPYVPPAHEMRTSPARKVTKFCTELLKDNSDGNDDDKPKLN